MTSVRAAGVAPALVLAGSLLWGCGGVPPATTRVDSAGVAIVTYSGPEVPLGWSLDTTLVLGGASEGSESFYRVRPSLVDTDASGRIYVLDDTGKRVAIFDSTGASLGVFGREGAGPGELEFPVSIAADPGGVLVYDGAKDAILAYTLEGVLRDPIPYPYSVIRMGFPHVQAEPGGLVLWARDRFQGSAARERMDRLWWVGTSGDTTELVPATPSPTSTAAYPECGMSYSIAVPFAPFPRWSQWRDRVAVNAWPAYRVNVFSGATEIMSIRRPEADLRLTESEAVERLKAQGFVAGPCNADAATVIRRHGFSPEPQVVRNVALAPSGRVWVQYEGRHGERRIDLYAADGTYEGSLSGDFPMPMTFLPGDRLVLQLVDSLDVERVGVARVVR